MHLLGHYLPEHKAVRIALRSFYGISNATASRILARLQIPDMALVSSLTEPQVTALSAYLSSPATSEPPALTSVVAPGVQASQPAERSAATATAAAAADPLNSLKIETDLRRSRQADIVHHRNVGTYKGRRHAMGLPVRGQNTRSNAKTARRLNRINRRNFSSSPILDLASFPEPPVPQPPSQILRLLGKQ